MQYRKLLAALIACSLLCSAAALPAFAEEVTEPAIVMTTEEVTETTEETTATETTASSAIPDGTQTAETSEYADPTEPSDSTTAESVMPAAEEVTEEATEETVNLTEAFVERLYQNILGRSADAQELADYASRLESGELTAADAVQGLFHSQEYLNRNTTNEDYVTQLYLTMLDREPDAGGFANWCSMARLFSRTYLLKGFIETSKFSEICKAYGIVQGTVELVESRDLHSKLTMYIYDLYISAKGSLPSADALNNWTGAVLQGEKPLHEVIFTFVDGKEFQSKTTTNYEYVNSLYRTILRKAPDTLTLQNDVAALKTGKTRFALLLDLFRSDAFQTLCAEKGLDSYLVGIDRLASAVQSNATQAVYQQPSTSAANWGKVYQNQDLTVTGFQGAWLRVSFHNQVGWLHRDNVTLYDGEGIRILPVSNIPQSSDIGGVPLPTGCEVASLSVLLQSMGMTDATKNLLADTYMPKGEIGKTDPNYAFIGQPEYSWSYGAYAGAIIKTAENYFADRGITGYQINNLTGADLDALYAQIDAGNPVLVWYTMNCTTTRSYGATWTFQRGTAWTEPGTGTYQYTWRKSEHCSVLVGYNKNKGTVILADVWANSGASSGGLTEYSVEKFLSAYEWLGSQAVTITETADHVFGSWTDAGDGTHTRVCVDCGSVETTAHHYGDWTDAGNGTHTRTCTDCGSTETASHTYGDWEQGADGTLSHHCTVCGITQTYVLGDVTMDHMLNGFDLAAMKHLLLTESTDPTLLPLADMNQDGSLTVVDIVSMQKFLLHRDA